MSFDPRSKYFMAGPLRLHYAEWGDPQAPPLILLHGGRDHCRSWDWAAEPLSKDWRVIAPDLRGHGDSDWSPEGNYSLLALVHDFTQLADHLNTWPLTIVAHSLGGNIALRYAGLYPGRVAKIVSIEGLGLPPKLIEERQALGVNERKRRWISEMEQTSAKRRHHAYPSFDEALQRMRQTNPNLTEAKIHHLTIHGVRQNEDKSFSWKFDKMVRVVSPVDITPEEVFQLWGAITCPVLLCYGADSWTSNPAQDGRAAHFKNAQVQIFPNAGHWLHHDQFDMFMIVLRRFLQTGELDGKISASVP